MPTIKNILIFLAIGTTFVLIYIFFIKPAPEKPAVVSTSATGVTTSTDTTTNTVAGNTASAQDFLNLLLSVKAIQLNDGIFQTSGFKSLVDTPVDLTPDGNEGRANPFAPIGLDATNTDTKNQLTCVLPQILDNTTNTCVNPASH